MTQQPRAETPYSSDNQTTPPLLRLLVQPPNEFEALRDEDQAEGQDAAEALQVSGLVSYYDLLKPMTAEQRKQHFAELAAEILLQPQTD